MRLHHFLPIVGLVLTPTIAAAQGRPVVVELFTSEGCSSCPPADRFLTELRGRRDLLPLAFHVTYWNSLGWRDPFSLEQATSRQNEYAQSFGGDSVFTPQMVVDGKQSVVGSNRVEAASAFAAAKDDATAADVRISRAKGRLSIRVGAGKGSGRLLLVGFDHEHRTAVGRGENSGQTLTESNIVRSLRSIGEWTGNAVTLSEAVPDGEEAAVLLQAVDGRITGAAREGSPAS